MKIGTKGIELIISFEAPKGPDLEAYQCPAGKWTIGYGHTGTVDGKPVAKGMKITQEKADELLREDLEKFEKKVSKYSYKWSQNEFDALVSFAFNIGSIDQLTACGKRSKGIIAEKFTAYNKSAGKVLEGLTRRREAEKALFLSK